MVNSAASLIVGDLKERVSIYRIGSTSVANDRFFHNRLSDVDLLVIAKNDSLKDYVSHFHSLANLDTSQLPNPDLLEIFSMSPDTVQVYLSCLSVIAGASSLDESNFVAGEKYLPRKDSPAPSLRTRLSLYRARMYDFYLEALRGLPYADTTKARKVVKNMLRAAKVTICANVSTDELLATENELFAAATFQDVQRLYEKSMHRSLDYSHYEVFDRVLSSGEVEDWPAWMMAQGQVISEILLLIRHFSPDREYILSSTVCRTLQGMLVIGVKNIINERNSAARDELIYNFANETASILVKLALEGVDELADFDNNDTPQVVKEAYDTMVRHLKGDVTRDVLFASSVILLEYALKRSIIYINHLTLFKERETIAL